MFIVIVRCCLRAVEIKLSEKMGLVDHYVRTDEVVKLRQMNVDVEEYGDIKTPAASVFLIQYLFFPVDTFKCFART